MSFTIPLGPKEDLKLSMSSSAPRVSDGWVLSRLDSFPNGFSTLPSHGKEFLHVPHRVYITSWISLSISGARRRLPSALEREGHDPQKQEYCKRGSDGRELRARREARALRPGAAKTD